MKEIEVNEILTLKELVEHLKISEKVLRKWISLKFRQIPCHISGNGKKAEICFFKEEIDEWFYYNGGKHLRNKVKEKKTYKSVNTSK